ncbi:MAG TPA: glycosyltransferase family 4 protein [Chloroflexota bacterium]|nr:glycosyltransferase family 4 protein [Chloroflexota bacterium]
MTRSLLLTSSFAPQLGGLETLLYQTCRQLAEPPLVLAPPPACAPDLVVRPVPTGMVGRAAYRVVWRAHPSLHYLTTFWSAARRAARTWQPEVWQVGHVALAPLAWLLARTARRPFVLYAHGQELLRPGSGLDRLLRGRALRAADAVFVQGSFTHRLVADWGVAAERIAEVPFGAQPRPPADPPSGTTLLSVGRLVPRKGIDTVLRALPRLPDEVQYRIVGSGPDGPRLRALADNLGVAARVRFLGRLDDEPLQAEYQRCALFVLPTRRTADGELEGFGLVFFEAAAWGRAVVAGRSGGEVDAVVDGKTGRLVDGTSVDQVGSVLRELLAEPRMLRRMGDHGRRRVETTYNWQNAAAVVDGVLERLG